MLTGFGVVEQAGMGFYISPPVAAGTLRQLLRARGTPPGNQPAVLLIVRAQPAMPRRQ